LLSAVPELEVDDVERVVVDVDGDDVVRVVEDVERAKRETEQDQRITHP